MNIQSMLPNLSQFLPTLLTAVLGALGLWFQEWRQSRSLRYQRKQARDEAQETLHFYKDWVDGHQSLCTPDELNAIKAEARAQLDKIYSSLLEAQHTRPRFDIQQTFFKRLLLLYAPPGLLGWVAHILFYSYLAFFVLMTLGISRPVDMGDFVADIFALILLFLPVLVLRAWAVELKRREHPRQPTSANATVPTNAPASMPSKPAQAA